MRIASISNRKLVSYSVIQNQLREGWRSSMYLCWLKEKMIEKPSGEVLTYESTRKTSTPWPRILDLDRQHWTNKSPRRSCEHCYCHGSRCWHHKHSQSVGSPNLKSADSLWRPIAEFNVRQISPLYVRYMYFTLFTVVIVFPNYIATMSVMTCTCYLVAGTQHWSVMSW